LLQIRPPTRDEPSDSARAFHSLSAGLTIVRHAGLVRRLISIVKQNIPMAYKDALVSDDGKSGWWESIRTIVYAVLIALLVRTFAYEPFNIPSKSMLPTLLVGDYLFVSKFSYGYSRYSMPLSLPLVPGRVLFTPPERGDVAVFKLPSDNRTDYIKRIIGLPGDEI